MMSIFGSTMHFVVIVVVYGFGSRHSSIYYCFHHDYGYDMDHNEIIFSLFLES